MNIQIFFHNVKFFAVICAFFFLKVYAADFQSAHSLGLAGAGHAGPLLADSIYFNPAFAASLPVRSVSASYYIQSLAHQKNYGKIFNVSILDGSVDNFFQGGLAFNRYYWSSALYVIAAKKIYGALQGGIGGKFFFINHQSTVLSDTYASIIYPVHKNFVISILLENLFEGLYFYRNIQPQTSAFYRKITIGSKLAIGSNFFLYFDPHVPFNTALWKKHFGYHLAAQVLLFADFYIRGGFFRNSMMPHTFEAADGYGFGAGWVAPKLTIDFGALLTPPPISARVLAIQLGVFF